MNNLQSITRTLGFVAVFLVIIGQFFRTDTPLLQPYLPYLIIFAIVALSISFYLRVKSDGVDVNASKIKFVLLFLIIVVAVVFLIYKLTT